MTIPANEVSQRRASEGQQSSAKELLSKLSGQIISLPFLKERIAVTNTAHAAEAKVSKNVVRAHPEIRKNVPQGY